MFKCTKFPTKDIQIIHVYQLENVNKKGKVVVCSRMMWNVINFPLGWRLQKNQLGPFESI